jgi:hypothetical protein
MFETRPISSSRRAKSKVTLNGKPVAINDCDPVIFAKVLRRRRRGRDSRRERLVKAEKALKAATR